jgi:hypothetical protein
MLESRITHQQGGGMAGNRRTTVSAPVEALATLEAEAERRGVALTVVLAEAIVEKATALRQQRRPRLGTGASGGRSPGAAQLTVDPVADEPR